MLWEFLAVIFAGLSGAGIMMGLRFLIKRLPKWTVPASAGLFMLAFTVYNEYHWYPHTKSRLPKDSEVIVEVPHRAFYKPWSYVKPQILQFVVLDKASIKPINAQQKEAMLYFFERRLKTHTLAITLDCQTQQQKFGNGDWHQSDITAPAIRIVCAK